MCSSCPGVVHGCQAFGQAMVDQGTSAVIVNTGSKQGITMPPGDTAYNVSKSGVKTLTEGLQHTLREIPVRNTNVLLGGFRALVPSLSWQIESSLFAHPCSAETQNRPRLFRRAARSTRSCWCLAGPSQ